MFFYKSKRFFIILAFLDNLNPSNKNIFILILKLYKMSFLSSVYVYIFLFLPRYFLNFTFFSKKLTYTLWNPAGVTKNS